MKAIFPPNTLYCSLYKANILHFIPLKHELFKDCWKSSIAIICVSFKLSILAPVKMQKGEGEIEFKRLSTKFQSPSSTLNIHFLILSCQRISFNYSLIVLEDLNISLSYYFSKISSPLLNFIFSFVHTLSYSRDNLVTSRMGEIGSNSTLYN